MTTRFPSASHRSSVLLIASWASLSGCTTGQTGGEIDLDPGPTEESAADGCEDASSASVAVTEETTVGISSQDMIEAIEGTHEAGLVWGEQVFEASVFPEAGESRITVEVRPKADTATLVDRQEREHDDGREGGNDDAAVELIEPDIGGGAWEQCPDRLTIEAEVIVTSENGAFNDTFDATFWTTDGVTISTYIDFELEELSGSFSVETEGNARAIQNSLRIDFAYGAISGKISGIVEEESGDGDGAGDAVSVSAGSNTYGRFPLELCDYGAAIAEGTLLHDAVVDTLSNDMALSFVWEGGESTTLDLTPELDGALCLEGGILRADVSAGLVTADGRIDATWPLTLEGEISDGELSGIGLVDTSWLEPIDGADFEAQTGISGYDESTLPLSYQFHFAKNALTGEANGSFTVVELNVPDCADPDYESEVIEEPGGGQSSPGCPGIDIRAELEEATIATPSSN